MNSAIYYVYKKKQLHQKKLAQEKKEEKVNTDDLITELEELLDLPLDNEEQSETTVDSMKVEVDRSSKDLDELDNIEKTLNL